MITKLYVIGNGFDRQHGLKSTYWDFKEYLKDKDAELVEKLEGYFGEDVLWSCFEETLANLDTEQIIEECTVYLEPYSTENWSDAYHHDYQYEVQRRIDMITEVLRKRFTEWILQLRLPDTAKNNLVSIEKRNSVFMNFNYTSTLERLYKVPMSNILYIHNKAIDTASRLILGHSRNPDSQKTLAQVHNDEDTDVRVAEGNRILDAYFVEMYKPTKKIIQENEPFFRNLNSLEYIYVYGHSLSEVDRPYFEEIVSRIDRENVSWKVSFHTKDDLIAFSQFFSHLGIPAGRITFAKMYDIDSLQLQLFVNRES